MKIFKIFIVLSDKEKHIEEFYLKCLARNFKLTYIWSPLCLLIIENLSSRKNNGILYFLSKRWLFSISVLSIT